MSQRIIGVQPRTLIRNVRPRLVLGTGENRRTYYANNFDIFNAVVWAREAMRVYEPTMVLGGLVHRDFDTDVHKFGDVVNALVPGQFQMKRKGALCEALEVQDGNASSIQVPLNQLPYVSFKICDGEEDRGLLDLVQTMLIPAVSALGSGVDRIIATQVYQFLANTAGHLGNLDETNIKDYILEAGEVMDNNNAPEAGRTMVVTPSAKTEALKLDLFTAVNQSGSNQGLVNRIIGRKFGFDFAMSQGAPNIRVGQDKVTTTTTAAAASGATTVALTSATGLAIGMWIVIAGDDVPQQITGIATLVFTIAPGLKHAVASGATVTAIKGGAVNFTAGYFGTTTSPRRVGWAKPIVTDGFTGVGPKVGQMVTFGITDTKYAIIGLTALGGGGFELMLDKPLEDAIADNATVNLGPAGQYNFGLIRNAFAMVNRPLPKPRTGALSSVISANSLSLRVTITYDGSTQAHLVTVDTLLGVGLLSDVLGVVMLG